MGQESNEWENMFLLAGSLDNILLVNFKSEALKPLTGKTLAEVVEMRGTSPENTIMDLIIEDGSRVGSVYFTQSEDIVRRAVALPWVSFNSDAASLAPEGVFLKSNPHPRAYGSFARVLGKYVRRHRARFAVAGVIAILALLGSAFAFLRIHRAHDLAVIAGLAAAYRHCHSVRCRHPRTASQRRAWTQQAGSSCGSQQRPGDHEICAQFTASRGEVRR